MVDQLTVGAPEGGGVYAWGPKINGRLIYIGKAKGGNGNYSSLRYRIGDELKEEKIFAWFGTIPTPKFLAIYHQAYPQDQNRTANHFNRSILKAGTNKIVWVCCPDHTPQERDDIARCERLLIKQLNPIANRHVVLRPGDAQAQGLADQVLEVIQNYPGF
jgi:hypothetical protein